MKAASGGTEGKHTPSLAQAVQGVVGTVIFAVLAALLVENQWFRQFRDSLSPQTLLLSIALLTVLGVFVYQADEARKRAALEQTDLTDWRVPPALRQRILNESAHAFAPDELRLELFRVVRIQTTCRWAFHPAALDRATGSPPNQGPTSDLPEIFRGQLNHRLLLVGNAGAGKTTALSQIGTSLVQRARENEDAPIPMRFLLSNWSSHKQDLSLEEWLREELKDTLSKEHARAFVNSDQLLPILEGLDEVRPDRYQACVREIQAFMRQVSLRPLAISFRAAIGEALPEFDLPVARVLDLSADEVEESLSRPEMKSTRELLEQSPELRSQISTPLWLEVAYLASKSLVAERHPNEAPTDYLYGRFVAYALTHNATLDQQEQTPGRIDRSDLFPLGWLAEKLVQSSRSDFKLADLASSWLDFKADGSEGLGVFLLHLPCLVLLWLPLVPLAIYLKGLLGDQVLWTIYALMAPPFIVPGDVTPFRRWPISLHGVFRGTNWIYLGFIAFSIVQALVAVYRQGFLPSAWFGPSLWLSIVVASVGTGVLLKTGDSEGVEEQTRRRGINYRISQSLKFFAVAYPLVLAATAFGLGTLGIAYIYLSIWEGPNRFTLLWAMKPLFSWYLFALDHTLVFPLTLAISSALWVVFLKNGGLFTAEHWVARLYLWQTGKLPLDMAAFLHRCSEQLLLVRRGERVEFFHPTFREYMKRKYGPNKQREVPYTLHRTPEILEEFRRERDLAAQKVQTLSASEGASTVELASDEEQELPGM